MRNIAAAGVILLVSFGLANADEFIATITKVEGTKLYMTKGGGGFKKGEKPPAPEELTMTATDQCKVVRGKFEFGTKKVELGATVEGGLKNKLFKNTPLRARITTEGDKVTEIAVFPNEFFATISKVDGQKVTFTKGGSPFGIGAKKEKGEEMTLTAIQDVKVVETKFSFENKKFKTESTPLAGGLKNEIFTKTPTGTIVVDDDNRITEIRVQAGFPFKVKDKDK